MSNEDLQQIQGLVAGAKTVLVLTHSNPSIDVMASVLAIGLAMQKMGKIVTMAMESAPLVEVANLVGIDKVVTALGGGKNLTLSYKPYAAGDFEKVLYPGDSDDPNAGFKLIIVPKDGIVPDVNNFSFSFSGGTAAADLIFTVDVLEPQQLGALYSTELFPAIPTQNVINIDNHDPNKDYGKFNLVEPDAASVSEITAFFLRAVNATLDADIAGNLYQGLQQATNNFSTPKTGAASFEAAAICKRAVPKAQTPAPQPAAPLVNQAVPEDWTQPKIFRGGGGNV